MVFVSFFKADRGEWDDKLIDKLTGGLGYSHCEILVSDNKSIGSHYIDGGVIECEYNNLLSDPRWDIWVLDITPAKVMKYLKDSLGEPYDAKGVIVTALTPFKYDVEGAKWCSELCAKALNEELKDYFDPLAMPNDLVRAILRHPKSSYVSTRSTEGSVLDFFFKDREELDRFGRVAKNKEEQVKRKERKELIN
jgi:hypothetical protein